LLGIIAGLVGWINQAYIKDQINWYWTMRPYRVVNFDPYVLKPEAERALKPLASFRECAKNCPEMIVIPAGEFMMGSPPNTAAYSGEIPQHKVTITKPFAVSKFVVTFVDWNACVSVGGCSQIGDSGMGGDTKPLINVTSDDVQDYLTWLTRMTGQQYRLLTEAEWEYAARAGTTTAYYWGDEVGTGNANCGGCGSKWDNRETSPVGSFKPNAFGLYDMAGNVVQLVEDCSHNNYEKAPTDGSAWVDGDCSRHMMRGGSWAGPPMQLRSANRGSVLRFAGYRFNYIGFRVGRTITP
jgi:formylglycine-generating enzyme required for sulfatase activity